MVESGILLDTHVLLWAAADSPRLSDAARDLLADLDVQPLFSAASIWEVTIKSGLGRSDFVVDPAALRRGLLANDYLEIPITGTHAVAVGSLPPMHTDPFDRLLLAQARTEGVEFATVDSRLIGLPGVRDVRA